MDKRIVGVNAGNVWHVLSEVKRISIPELARKLNLSVESTALAVGWLARENKIEFATNPDDASDLFFVELNVYF